jgi:hypothetical protein
MVKKIVPEFGFDKNGKLRLKYLEEIFCVGAGIDGQIKCVIYLMTFPSIFITGWRKKTYANLIIRIFLSNSMNQGKPLFKFPKGGRMYPNPFFTFL